MKCGSIFCLRTGNALVGINANQIHSVFLGVCFEKFFLRLQAVELVLFVRGYTAICDDIHHSRPPFLNRSGKKGRFFRGGCLLLGFGDM
jgi:hypothetical protein